MEVRPGYKQTEVGVIPDDWSAVPIEAITTHIGDGLHGTPVYSSGGGFFFINGNNLQDGRIVVTNETKSVEHSEFIKHRKPLSGRSILMSINGTIGKLGLFDSEPIVLGKSAAYLNVKPEFSRQYLYQFLQTEIVRQQFYDGLTGSTIGNLGLATIRQTYIALPPTNAEQRAIATALSDMDALLGALGRLIAKKRNLKQAAMQQLLTGQTRLPGFSGEWEVSTIGEQAQIFGRIGFRGYTVDDIVEEGNGAIAINPSNIQDGEITFEKCTYVSWHKYEESPEIIVDEGDIVLVKTGSTVGKTAMVINLPEKATLNPQVVVFKSLKANPAFFGYVMGFSVVQKQIMATVVGGAVPTLSQKLAAEFKLPLPPVPEQSAIAAVLSDMDTEIKALEARRAKTRELKQAMMQELLTGRTRLV